MYSVVTQESKNGALLEHSEVDNNWLVLVGALNDHQSRLGTVEGMVLDHETRLDSHDLVIAGMVDKTAENTFSAAQTFDKAIFQKNLPNAGTTLDLKETSHFKKTIAANTTFAVSNVPAAGYTASFLLELTNGGAYTVNWWAGMKWASGTPPVLTAAGRDVMGFFTSDGGATWTGVQIVKDAK